MLHPFAKVIHVIEQFNSYRSNQFNSHRSNCENYTIVTSPYKGNTFNYTIVTGIQKLLYAFSKLIIQHYTIGTFIYKTSYTKVYNCYIPLQN